MVKSSSSDFRFWDAKGMGMGNFFSREWDGKNLMGMGQFNLLCHSLLPTLIFKS